MALPAQVSGHLAGTIPRRFEMLLVTLTHCPIFGDHLFLPPSFAGAPLRQPFAHQATQRVQHRGTDRKRCCGVVVGFHQQGCLLKQFSLCRGFTHFIPLRASRPTGAAEGSPALRAGVTRWLYLVFPFRAV